jgi:hypothetical protein
MEYHMGRESELLDYLRSAGFEITLFRPDSAFTGNLWARRKSGTPAV